MLLVLRRGHETGSRVSGGGRVDWKPETAATVRAKGIMGDVSRNRKQTGRSTNTEKRCATPASAFLAHAC